MKVKICELCKQEFTLNPRLGLKWVEKTGRGRFCSDKCSRQARRGKRVSVATEFKDVRGEKHPRWKGGEEITVAGYRRVYAPDHPKAHKGKVSEHVLVMEAYLGRYLQDKEVVHHINGNKLDNQLHNLQLFSSHSEHMKVEFPKGAKFHAKA